MAYWQGQDLWPFQLQVAIYPLRGNLRDRIGSLCFIKYDQRFDRWQEHCWCGWFGNLHRHHQYSVFSDLRLGETAILELRRYGMELRNSVGLPHDVS